MAPKKVERERAVALSQSFQGAFSHLAMRFDAEAIALEIPKQPGLDFEVEVNLQGDELHLNAGNGFGLEWFPCTDNRVEDDFAESVRGLLSGRFRIVEYRHRGDLYKATLQRPTQHGWKNHGTWMRPSWPAWRTSTSILQSQPDVEKAP